MLTRIRPAPSHASHRPPFTFVEKWRFASPAALASGVAAKQVANPVEHPENRRGRTARRPRRAGRGRPRRRARSPRARSPGRRPTRPSPPPVSAGGQHVEHQRGLAAARHAGERRRGRPRGCPRRGPAGCGTGRRARSRRGGGRAARERARSRGGRRPVRPGSGRSPTPRRAPAMPAALPRRCGRRRRRRRAQVDHVVGRADHLFVVLDHDDRVAGVPKGGEQAEQPRGVARVQARGRLVEDVGDAREAVGDAGRQAAPAAPRRPRASRRAGRARGSRARRRPAARSRAITSRRRSATAIAAPRRLPAARPARRRTRGCRRPSAPAARRCSGRPREPRALRA